MEIEVDYEDPSCHPSTLSRYMQVIHQVLLGYRGDEEHKRQQSRM